jgi:ribosomal protein L37AE/L43A
MGRQVRRRDERENRAMIIAKPSCSWIAMKFKDKRKGSFWLCRSCGLRGKGKAAPTCPCAPIAVAAMPQLR